MTDQQILNLALLDVQGLITREESSLEDEIARYKMAKAEPAYYRFHQIRKERLDLAYSFLSEILKEREGTPMIG